MSTHHRTRAALLLTALALLPATTARADEAATTAQNPPPPASSPMLAIAGAISRSVGGLGAIHANNVRFGRVLILERLPNARHAVAEVSLTIKGREIRLPFKLARTAPQQGCPEGWVVTWIPHKAYIEGLLALAASDTLPEVATSTPWAATPRLPALPVLLTRQRMITPLGPLTSPKGVEQTVALTGVPALDPPLLLVQHANAWTKHILERDDAPAAFDVIADGRVSWQRFQRVLIGIASQGFYRVHLITRHQQALHMLSATAPVFGDLPGDKADKPVPLVLAYTPTDRGAAFRISVGGKLIVGDGAACAPGAAVCVASPAQLGAALTAALATVPADQRKRLRFATFATDGATPLSDALPWLQALAPALGIPPRRIFLTIIRGEAK